MWWHWEKKILREKVHPVLGENIGLLPDYIGKILQGL
jgi:hypothetical protein